MVPNATTVRASTSANTGTTALREVRVACASPTNTLTPGRALASRSSSRSTKGYPRTTTMAARTATSTGAAPEYTSTLPAVRPCCRSTMIPPTAAAASAASATRRRAAAVRRDPA